MSGSFTRSGVWLCALNTQGDPHTMKIAEVVLKPPTKPMNPAQARVFSLRTRVKTAQDALKRERETQRRQREAERQRKAMAASKPMV